MTRTAVATLLASLLVAPAAQGGPACTPPSTIREAGPREVRAFFARQQRRILTFLGYSGAGYEDEPGMLAAAARVLDEYDPKRTIVTIGATADGIGAVYEAAKAKGFRTAGIVSTQAKELGAALSPCVDVVFYVKDSAWGGLLPKTKTLSPTSTAMVESSDVLVAIGGGVVARDELMAAKRAGKRVRFIAADMNHAKALEKARKTGENPPTDFHGEAAAAFGGIRDRAASDAAPTRRGGSR